MHKFTATSVVSGIWLGRVGDLPSMRANPLNSSEFERFEPEIQCTPCGLGCVIANPDRRLIEDVLIRAHTTGFSEIN